MAAHAPSHAEVMLLQGDAEGAPARSARIAGRSRAVARFDGVGRSRSHRRLAVEQSRRARRGPGSLDRAFALAHERQGYGGLPLAVLYEARAGWRWPPTIGTCLPHFRAQATLLARAHAPALVNAYEALREASSKHIAGADSLPAVAVTRTAHTQASTSFSEVRTRLTAFGGRADRMRQVLELLLEDSGAKAGHLFLFRADGLHACASSQTRDSEHAPATLLALAQCHVEAEIIEAKTVAVTIANLPVDALDSALPTLLARGASLMPVLLIDRSEARPMLAGIAMLDAREANLRPPRTDLVEAISRCLLLTGDAVPRPLDA